MTEDEFKHQMSFTIGACLEEGNEELANHLEKLVQTAVRFKNGEADRGELYDLWWKNVPPRTSLYQAYAVEQSRRLVNNFAGL